MGAFLSLSTAAPISANADPPKRSPFASLSSHHSTAGGKGDTARRTGLFKLSAALYSLHFFLHALCLLYTLARATVFCIAQRPNNDGGTLCKLFNVLPFHPSSLLPSQDLREFNAIPSFRAFSTSLSLSHLLFFSLYHLIFNYIFDILYIFYIYFYIYYNVYLIYLFYILNVLIILFDFINNYTIKFNFIILILIQWLQHFVLQEYHLRWIIYRWTLIKVYRRSLYLIRVGLRTGLVPVAADWPPSTGDIA